jgi:hypothetical protein
MATRTLRLAAPFIDRRGLSFICDALARATTRGVMLEILLPTRSTHADDALEELKATIIRSGAIGNFRVSRLRFDAPAVSTASRYWLWHSSGDRVVWMGAGEYSFAE